MSSTGRHVPKRFFCWEAQVKVIVIVIAIVIVIVLEYRVQGLG